MKKLLTAVAVAVAALVGSASAASAAATVCYDVTVVANGSTVVDEAACQTVAP